VESIDEVKDQSQRNDDDKQSNHCD
jgi:hypothetical protein